MNVMGLVEFNQLATNADVVPVFRTLRADTETPVSAFLKINNGAHAFLYESAEGGKNWGRYSFLGSTPALTVQQHDYVTTVHQQGEVSVIEAPPLDALRQIIQRRRVADVDGLPRFVGGLVGYFGYESVHLFEPKVPQRHGPDPVFPTSEWMFIKNLVVFDNARNELKLVSCVDLNEFENTKAAYNEAMEQIQTLEDKLHAPLPTHDDKLTFGRAKSLTTRQEYREAIERIKQYITAGDCMQVVYSRRITTEFDGEPFELYRRLRASSLAPYMYYLQFDDRVIVGASPEVLVRLEKDKITVRPIAGTRRRGENEAQDAKLEAELRTDPKERAEHMMLLDLGRNDVGRVAQVGSVRVEEQEVIEKYSHVIHLVSQVSGLLAEDKDVFDVLASAFPAGTLSGAPKIRAMQIIDELEKVTRGPYGGAVGYVDFRGDSDFAITIRTMVAAGKELRFQAGGGIVADSDAEREYEETREKLRGPLTALGIANSDLDAVEGDQ